MYPMKGLLLLTLLLFTGLGNSRAQNIALGERVPDLKVEKWLDNRRPAATPLTYIEFYHSSNRAGSASLDQLQATARQMKGRLHIVVVTREREEKVVHLLRPYLSEHLYVGFDPSGHSFDNFGVSYLPFGVLVDAKNRALWMGNSLQITVANIEKITQ